MSSISQQIVEQLVHLGWLDPAHKDDDLSSPAVKTAVTGYQSFWQEDLHPAAQKALGRYMSVDGEVGKVTAGHMFGRMCGCPDIARASDGAVIREEANIPEDCRFKYKLYFDHSRWRSSLGLSKGEANELFDRALADWNSVVGLGLSRVDSSSEASCTVKWESLSGSTLAWSHLANNSCRRDKQQRYDIRSWNRHMFYLVVLHEVGHLIGLPHKSGNYIMNPSIITSLDGLTETDVRRARNLGYGAPKEPDPPTPPRPSGGLAVDELTVELQNGDVIRAAQIKRINFGARRSGGGLVFNL